MSGGVDAALPADWLVPDWPAPAGVQALCTTRAGGVSQGPYASMNLGTHVGDDPQAVQTNRARLQVTLGQSTPGAHAPEGRAATPHSRSGSCRARRRRASSRKTSAKP